MTYLQRKKLAFINMVNKVKGFIRTVSGVPPLVLTDCVDDESLINYSISGNGLGNLTKNMFEIRTPDLKGQSAYNGYGGMNYTVYDNSLIISAYTGIGFWFNNLEAGATYTLSCKFLTSGTSGVNFVIGQNNGQSATSTIKKQAYDYQLKEGEIVSLTFTADETNLLSFGLGNSIPIEIGEIQLEKNSVVTNFEPYGYKIPIVCKGKNLFDKRKSSQQSIQDETVNAYWFKNVLNASNFAEMINGAGTYAISYDIEFVEVPENHGKCDSRYGISICNSSATTIPMQAVWNYREAGYKARVRNKVTLTESQLQTPSLAMYAYSNAYYATEDKTSSKLVYSKVIISNIQIEKSIEATNFEPYAEPVTTNIYLDKPLKEGETLTNPVRLPTVKGTTIYTVDTTVQPSDMSVTYYSTSKE